MIWCINMIGTISKMFISHLHRISLLYKVPLLYFTIHLTLIFLHVFLYSFAWNPQRKVNITTTDYVVGRRVINVNIPIDWPQTRIGPKKEPRLGVRVWLCVAVRVCVSDIVKCLLRWSTVASDSKEAARAAVDNDKKKSPLCYWHLTGCVGTPLGKGMLELLG